MRALRVQARLQGSLSSLLRQAAQRRGWRAPQLARAASGAGGGGGQIQPPDVRELARMAHIEVTDEEVADWGPKIASVVQWFGQLQEVDVEGVPPALRAAGAGEGSALRADEPHVFEQRQEMLQQAPATEGLFLKVPKIATAADD